MDSIKITKIEDSEAITITKEDFENVYHDVITDMRKDHPDDMPAPLSLMEMMISMKTAIELKKRLFKEN